jgi:nucleoside-diphosphate-sugar epimerase
MTAVVVRPATVCGVSPRQRFDLAVNILTINALVKQKISVFGGEQFRPNLHIDDMCESYTHLLRSADNLISNKTFNVGAKNHSLSEIATTVQKLIGKEIEIEYKHTNDVRSYRVDSSKIKNELGYSPIRGVEQAINDLIDAYNHKQFINPLSNMAYTNIFRMKELKLA